MENGFITLSRKFLDWQWIEDGNMVKVFIQLLFRANLKTKKWKGETVERGQLVMAVSEFAKEHGLGRQQLRTCLARLEQDGTISLKSTNKYTVITICNYDTYQLGNNEPQPSSNQQITNKQPTNNQQITTTKERNNNKNNNNLSLRERENAHATRTRDLPPHDLAERAENGMGAAELCGEKQMQNENASKLGGEKQSTDGGERTDRRQTDNQKHVEAIRQEGQKQQSDRDRYIRQLTADAEWMGLCQVKKNLIGKDMKPYLYAFYMQQPEGKRWKSYEDFKMHFRSWLRYADDAEVNGLYQKHMAAREKARQAEQRRQEQQKAEAEWAEHKQHCTPMPEHIRQKLLGNEP